MTSNRDKAKKVLQALRGSYRKSFSDMSAEDLKMMIDIWETGMERVEDRFIWEALDWFLYESRESFAPTIGQFLAKAEELRMKYEMHHPVIRNSWEVENVS